MFGYCLSASGLDRMILDGKREWKYFIVEQLSRDWFEHGQSTDSSLQRCGTRAESFVGQTFRDRRRSVHCWYCLHSETFQRFQVIPVFILRDRKTLYIALETFVKTLDNWSISIPLKMCSTLKIFCRRSSLPIDTETLQSYPLWLPTTFNLTYELPKFISYFQHREKKWDNLAWTVDWTFDRRDLDNHWIVKPFNLARSIDTHVTKNLNAIIRLADSGPKVRLHFFSSTFDHFVRTS